MDDLDFNWPSAPEDVRLEPEAIHVWALSLRTTGEALEQMEDTLSAAERRRADSFHFERDRNRFIAGHGTLRAILSQYLLEDPLDLVFEQGRKGKPALSERFEWSQVHFNLTHCDDLALLAVARDREIGIDVERIRALDDLSEVASICCSPRERAELWALPEEERAAAFLRLWTRKEAWLKATGEGICESLGEVEVSFRAGDFPRIVMLPAGGKTDAKEWSVRELTPAPGFVGAIALPGAIHDICLWQWARKEALEYATH